MGHKLQMYENLRDMLEREIGEIERKHDLNKESLDNLYKLTMSLKVVDKCIDRNEMEEGMKKGQEGFSQARGRDAMGRYTSRDGASMDGMSNAMRPYWMYDGMMSREMSNAQGGNSYAMNTSNAGYNQSNAGYNTSNEQGGQSNAMRRGADGDNDGRYNESRDNFRNSQDRGRSYADGTSYGYSRDASRKKMVQKLETLMDDTMSEKERRAIQDCISEIDK